MNHDNSPQNNPATDPATRAEALRLADEFGPERASEMCGVPSSTIRSWRRRTGKKVTSASRKSKEQRVEETIDSLVEASDEGIARLRATIPRASGVQSLSIAIGVCLDKAHALEQRRAEAKERERLLDDERGELLFRVVQHYHEALGLPFTPDARRLFGDLVRRADSDDHIIYVDPALAEPARAGLELPAALLPPAEEIADVELVEPDPVDVLDHSDAEPEPVTPPREEELSEPDDGRAPATPARYDGLSRSFDVIAPSKPDPAAPARHNAARSAERYHYSDSDWG